jgi:hypothetical protein
MTDLFAEYGDAVSDCRTNVGVDEAARLLIDHWSYDLYERKPRPALLENGALTPTDLDLACFLAALVDRKAVIVLPSYKARRARTEREGEVVVSRDNRHGKVVGLVSHQDLFSFGVRIVDENVVTSGEFTKSGEDETGAYRSFMLQDVTGEWHDGWKKIEFLPSRKENAFLSDKKLWTGNTVVFDKFIHPNRWVSFWGQYYLFTKVVEHRLTTEASHLRQEVKRLRSEGHSTGDQYSLTGEKEGEHREVTKSEDTPIKVKTLEAEVTFQKSIHFPLIESSTKGLKEATKRLNHIQYGLLPPLRFAIRATEFAAFKFGRLGEGEPYLRLPTWIKREWIEGNVKQEPRARTMWNRLTMPDRPALWWRVMERTTRVAT